MLSMDCNAVAFLLSMYSKLCKLTRDIRLSTPMTTLSESNHDIELVLCCSPYCCRCHCWLVQTMLLDTIAMILHDISLVMLSNDLLLSFEFDDHDRAALVNIMPFVFSTRLAFAWFLWLILLLLRFACGCLFAFMFALLLIVISFDDNSCWKPTNGVSIFVCLLIICCVLLLLLMLLLLHSCFSIRIA